MATPDTKGYGDENDNKLAQHVSDASLVDVPTITGTRREPPELVKNLSLEERQHLETALVRKIDLRLLPMLILMYIMNYLDRNNIASARLAGLQDPHSKGGLDLTSTQYLTALSILFVGYLLMQIPSNLFLNKIGKPALYLPTVMIIWGVISAATAGAQSYGGLIAIRFFLGFVEAAYFPGCLFFLSSWYTRKELGFRTAMLYSGALLSGAFSGLIAAGIKNGLDGARGLRAWRWLFIIEGVITIFFAFCSYFALPNFPRTTSWLTEEERQLAIWRLEEDIGEDDWIDSSQQTFFHGMNLAFQDIKTWILVSLPRQCFSVTLTPSQMVLLFGFVASGTVTNLFPTVVATLGYSDVDSLLLTVPPYILAVVTSFCNAWHADKTGERYFHITLPLYFAVIAFIIAATTTTIGPRYFAMMLMPAGVYTGYGVALGWISNTLPRPPAKVVYISCPRKSHTDTYSSVPLLSQPSMRSPTAPQSTLPTCIQSQRDRATVRFSQS